MDEWGCFFGVCSDGFSHLYKLWMNGAVFLGFVVMALAISILFRHPLR